MTLDAQSIDFRHSEQCFRGYGALLWRLLSIAPEVTEHCSGGYRALLYIGTEHCSLWYGALLLMVHSIAFTEKTDREETP